MAMAAFAHRRFLPRLFPSAFCRGYLGSNAAAVAARDCEFWELPLPSREDSNGDRIDRGAHWIFMGYPAAGRAVYARRLAELLAVPHISMGDLLRQELDRPTLMAKQLSCYLKQGKLISDEVIFSILYERLEKGVECGERGFIIDGFPRTTCQAEYLDNVVDVDLVVNLNLSEDAVVAKCSGRRICSECGRDFNVANVDIEGPGERRIYLPSLPPPEACWNKMVTKLDDSEEITRRKLQIYQQQSKPVEDYYRSQHKLLDFEIVGGVSQTWPRLLEALQLEEKKPRQCLTA